MKKFSILGSYVLCLAVFSCQSNKQAATACIDPTKIDNERACTMQYEPVCGCDGKTYSNACAADIKGVTSYTPGECAAKSTNN